MCIFTGSECVVRVHDTRIFARLSGCGAHYLVYQVDADGRIAEHRRSVADGLIVVCACLPNP